MFPHLQSWSSHLGCCCSCNSNQICREQLPPDYSTFLLPIKQICATDTWRDGLLGYADTQATKRLHPSGLHFCPGNLAHLTSSHWGIFFQYYLGIQSQDRSDDASRQSLADVPTHKWAQSEWWEETIIKTADLRHTGEGIRNMSKALLEMTGWGDSLDCSFLSIRQKQRTRYERVVKQGQENRA